MKSAGDSEDDLGLLTTPEREMFDIRKTLTAIGERNGIDLTLDDAGAAALVLADERMMHVQLQENVDRLVLLASLGTVSPEQRATIFERLLAANHYWDETNGATLAWQPALEQVILELPIPLAGTDEATLTEAFKGFLLLQEDWAGRLARAIEETFEAAEPSVGDDDFKIGI